MKHINILLFDDFTTLDALGPAEVFARLKDHYTVDYFSIDGGMVSGSAGVSGAAITYDGGSTLSDGSGNYSFTVPWSWSGTVTPSKFGYVFSPPSRTYPALTADQVGQNYTAAAPAFTASLDRVLGAESRPSTFTSRPATLRGGALSRLASV